MMNQSLYCVACDAGMFPLPPALFSRLISFTCVLTVAMPMLAPAAPTLQDPIPVRWIFDGAAMTDPKVLVGCVRVRNQSDVVSKL